MSTQETPNQPNPTPQELVKLLNSLPGPLVLSQDSTRRSIGFVDHKSGVVIAFPELSSCGRFEVDPMETYGASAEQVQALQVLNNKIAQAVVEAVNAMCFAVQETLGVTDGGVASAMFSGDEFERGMREKLADYAMTELRFMEDDDAA